MISFKKGV